MAMTDKTPKTPKATLITGEMFTGTWCSKIEFIDGRNALLDIGLMTGNNFRIPLPIADVFELVGFERFVPVPVTSDQAQAFAVAVQDLRDQLDGRDATITALRRSAERSASHIEDLAKQLARANDPATGIVHPPKVDDLPSLDKLPPL